MARIRLAAAPVKPPWACAGCGDPDKNQRARFYDGHWSPACGSCLDAHRAAISHWLASRARASNTLSF